MSKPIKKAPNDIMKVTLTCTISKYNINNINRIKDNVSIRVCNASGYVVTSSGLKNVKLVLYNDKYIKLFENFPQEGTKFLVLGRLSFRTYEKDGIKHDITEIIVNDQDEMYIWRTKKKVDDNPTSETKPINNNPIVVEESLDEFNFDAFIEDFDKEQ